MIDPTPSVLPAALGDLRVLDLSRVLAGPWCTQILGDLGADVVKIEAPAGDTSRHLGGVRKADMTGFFAQWNRNKRSVVLDLKQETARAALARLAQHADVLVENFRPAVMERLGLGWEALARANPRLVYVSHKGFLPGPYENRVALDEVAQMMGGLSYMTGPPGRPLRAGTSVNDIMGGMFGAIGIMSALIERQHTDRGQEIQSALFENCVFLVAQHMQQYSMTGVPPPPMPARVSPWSVYDVFTLADGAQLFIAAVNDKQWQVLCRILERPDLAADPALATNEQRVHARPALLQRLREVLRQHDIDALSAKLEASGLPYAPIVRPEQLLQDAHLRRSGGLVPMQTDDGSITDVVLLPLLVGGRRPGVRQPLAKPGEHNEEVLGQVSAAFQSTDP